MMNKRTQDYLKGMLLHQRGDKIQFHRDGSASIIYAVYKDNRRSLIVDAFYLNVPDARIRSFKRKCKKEYDVVTIHFTYDAS
jgi:uncharacterized protein YbaA (DUF1428 family)